MLFGNRQEQANMEIEHRLTVIESLLKTVLAILSFMSLALLWSVGQTQANTEWRRSHEAFLREEDPYKRLDKVESDVNSMKSVMRMIGATLVAIATPVAALLFEAIRKGL